MCNPVATSSDPESSAVEIQVRLFGPHLEPLGTAVSVGEMDECPVFAAECEVGFWPDAILAAWCVPIDAHLYVRPLAVRPPP